MTLENVVIALLVFITMAGVDYCLAQYTRFLMQGKGFIAACWSVAQWMCATVGFVVVIKVSFWYLTMEALGLAVGTYFGARRFKSHDLQRRDQDQVPGMPTQHSGSAEPRDKRIAGFAPPISRGD